MAGSIVLVSLHGTGFGQKRSPTEQVALDLVGLERLDQVGLGGGGREPFQGLGGEQDVAPEVAFDELADFGAGVGADFVESINAEVDRATIDQALEEFGVFDFVAVEFFLDRFDRAISTFGGGKIDDDAIGLLQQVAQKHGFAHAGIAFEHDLTLEPGNCLLEWQDFVCALTFDIGAREVEVGVEAIEGGIGEEGDFEWLEQFAAQEGNPGEQKGDVAQPKEVANPGISEENCLDRGGFGIEKDQRQPEGGVCQ